MLVTAVAMIGERKSQGEVSLRKWLVGSNDIIDLRVSVYCPRSALRSNNGYLEFCNLEDSDAIKRGRWRGRIPFAGEMRRQGLAGDTLSS